MILFKEEHVDAILRGKKTQTRRSWKTARAKIGSIHLAKTVMLSKEFFAKLEILDVWQEKLGEISIDDCRAELCSTNAEYLDLFWKINLKNLEKTGWTRATLKNFEVYAIKFKLYEIPTTYDKKCGKFLIPEDR